MSISGMRFRQLSTCLFLMARSTTGLAPQSGVRPAWTCLTAMGQACARRNVPKSSLIQRNMSSGTDQEIPIRHIGKEEMKQILMEHEERINAELESPYYVLDVRTEPEVMQTGKVSPSVPTLPVQAMMPPYNAMLMDEEDFREAFGFEKPPKDSTLVFTCAAGIRSVSACKLAQQAGYKNCVNYMGGAKEWFYS